MKDENLTADTGIRPEVIAAIRKKAEDYGIRQVTLFGSRARGDFKRTSDIDLAVSGGDFVRFAIDVEEETPTLLKYDFVDLDSDVQEALLREIQKDGRVIYEEI